MIQSFEFILYYFDTSNDLFTISCASTRILAASRAKYIK